MSNLAKALSSAPVWLARTVGTADGLTPSATIAFSIIPVAQVWMPLLPGNFSTSKKSAMLLGFSPGNASGS